MHEIITIQIGREANYVGTHYWNTQSSYTTPLLDHNISFQPSLTSKIETPFPRTLIYDFKSSLGSFIHDQDPIEPETPAEEGLTTIQTTPSTPSHPYQVALSTTFDPPTPLPETVRYWSDYNRTFFNRRSIHPLSDSPSTPGFELFNNLDTTDNGIVDTHLRPLLEECDHLQGLQFLTSTTTPWNDFTTSYLEQTHDEVGKIPLWVWGCGSDSSSRRVVQQARMLLELSERSSVYIPLSGREGCLWETSALQCATMETLTLPSRLHSGGSALFELGMSLTGGVEGRTLGRATLYDPNAGQQNWIDVSEGRVEVWRREREGSKVEREGWHTVFCVPVLFPLLSSFPPVWGRDGEIEVGAGIDTSAEVGVKVGELRDGVIRARVRGEERDYLVDGLATLAGRYGAGEGSSEEEDE